jgi:hypothetical protein
MNIPCVSGWCLNCSHWRRLPALFAASLLFLLMGPVVSGQAPASSFPTADPLPPDAALPAWPGPGNPSFSKQALEVRSGNLELSHSAETFGAFVLRVAGEPMAIGQDQPMLAYLLGGHLRWVKLAGAAGGKFELNRAGRSLQLAFQFADPDGGHWQFTQRFSPGRITGAIELVVQVRVDQDRAVAFLPMFMLFPGAGSFGSTKGQGLFAGLEYLENEPSSSEADIIGPASKREVPDNLKITFPLMVVQNAGRYVGLTWEMQPEFCALYDSPDRLFGSGGHVMGVLFPGSDGHDRQEGDLLPRLTALLKAGRTVVLRATLLGGRGASVVPAVQQYVALRGLPSLGGAASGSNRRSIPSVPFQQYISQAAGGWLDSKLREGPLFHHAIAGGNFPPGPAADAAMWMDWLASRSDRPELADRLRSTAREALAAVPPGDWNFAGVGHVRYPAPALCYGHVSEAAARAQRAGRALLADFQPDLSVQYHPRPGGPDYSKTHYSKEANGYTSRPVLDLLQAAAFCGDPLLLEAALKELRAMDKFHDGVPRGAQTWECPLHIPDILAAAQMVRAYTLGYELSGDPRLLKQAQYWAWTGVPFVYLVNPTPHPIGLYSTIAVFGATNWKAPVWLGLPVQWCGLVYADSLYWLARDDAKGPWKQLADGISFSGIQQSWPSSDSDLQGLLPDSFVLRAQHRNGPAINPATLEANALRFFGQTPVYDFWAARHSSLRIQAPGKILRLRDKKTLLAFQVQTWLEHPYFVLINGLTRRPRIRLEGKTAEGAARREFDPQTGRLILTLAGHPRVELSLAAP